MANETFWRDAAAVTKEHKARIRLYVAGELGLSMWDRTVFCPTEGYVEIPAVGPVLERDVEWYEIDPNVAVDWVQGVPQRLEDRTSAVLHSLEDRSVPFEIVAELIRVKNPSFQASAVKRTSVYHDNVDVSSAQSKTDEHKAKN